MLSHAADVRKTPFGQSLAELGGRRLGELHRGGVLTDEEFAAAKRKLLDL